MSGGAGALIKMERRKQNESETETDNVGERGRKRES